MSTGTGFAPLLRLRWHRCSYNGVVIFHYAPPERKGENGRTRQETCVAGPGPAPAGAAKTPVETRF